MERSQLAAIHIAKKEAGLSEKNYRKLLDYVAGVSSSKYLSDDGYQAVMRELKGIQYDNQTIAEVLSLYDAIDQLDVATKEEQDGQG